MKVRTVIKLKKFFSKYPLRQYHRGQILVHAEDRPTDIYFLCGGRVRQYSITGEGSEIILYVYRELSIFPFSNVLGDHENSYFFDASEDIAVRVAPIEAVREFFMQNPEIVYDLLSSTQEMMDRLIKRLSFAMASNAYYRLLFELVSECQQSCEKQQKIYTLPIHEYELAGQAGLSRETANREMKKLKRRGLITINRKFITVKNFLALKKELDSYI